MNCLLLIDIQHDFMPGGSLAVAQGDTIIAPVNAVQPQFELVVATQDWHPQNHISFAINHPHHQPFDEIDLNGRPQTLWPAHCVQNSAGAAFHPLLKTNQIEAVFRKGTNPKIDSYSAFYDNAHQKNTGLSGYLKDKGVTTLFFAGLAADICVYFSIKDALAEGFSCVVIEDGVKALDTSCYANQRTVLQKAGIRFTTSSNLIKDFAL